MGKYKLRILTASISVMVAGIDGFIWGKQPCPRRVTLTVVYNRKNIGYIKLHYFSYCMMSIMYTQMYDVRNKLTVPNAESSEPRTRYVLFHATESPLLVKNQEWTHKFPAVRWRKRTLKNDHHSFKLYVWYNEAHTNDTHTIIPWGIHLLQKLAFCLKILQLTAREGPDRLMRIAWN